MKKAKDKPTNFHIIQRFISKALVLGVDRIVAKAMLENFSHHGDISKEIIYFGKRRKTINDNRIIILSRNAIFAYRRHKDTNYDKNIKYLSKPLSRSLLNTQ